MLLKVITRTQMLGWRTKNLLRSEKGQTSSEYMVIAGILVALLIVIFGFFREEVTGAFKTMATSVKTSLGGGGK